MSKTLHSLIQNNCPKCTRPLNVDHTHRTYEEHDACRNAFERWWDEQIRLAQIHLGSGDYLVSKGIAKKAFEGGRNHETQIQAGR
jgi:hypothetical protein